MWQILHSVCCEASAVAESTTKHTQKGMQICDTLQLVTLCTLACMHSLVSRCHAYHWHPTAIGSASCCSILRDNNMCTGCGILSLLSQPHLQPPSPKQQTVHSAATSAATSLKGRPSHCPNQPHYSETSSPLWWPSSDVLQTESEKLLKKQNCERL